MNKHTHTHTPGAVGSHLCCAPWEQLGVWCLAQGSHLSRGIEGGESAGHSLPPPTIPAGPETQTHDLWVTSPTLYPLGHDCSTLMGLNCYNSCFSGQLDPVYILHVYAYEQMNTSHLLFSGHDWYELQKYIWQLWYWILLNICSDTVKCQVIINCVELLC